jgi:N-acetylglucosaminyl-diphospho-decaprenol L-rhamnosyltransferase
MTSFRTAAVVVRWRGGDEVDRCLRSLLQHGGRELERVVLVDSGSADGGAERLAAAFPEVEVVTLDENRSFAFAANRGADRSDSPGLLLLNPDTELTPGAVDTLIDELARRPEAAGVVPLLAGADGAPQHRWQLRRLPGPLRLATGRGGAAQFRGAAPAEPAMVEQPAAAAWLVRRAAWNELGGLAECFAPAWWEDVDFCARLRGLGGKRGTAGVGFWVVPGARVAHRGGSSLAQLTDSEFLVAYHRNLLRYAERHHPHRFAAIRTILLLSLCSRALLRPSRREAYRATADALAATRR